jgi:hypothetical protein
MMWTLVNDKRARRADPPRAGPQLLRGTAVDDPPDASTHHRGISANTPQPRYSRV